MTLEVPVENITPVADDGTKGTKAPSELFLFKQAEDGASTHSNNFNPNWEHLSSEDVGSDLSGETRTYVFGYDTPINPGETTESLFDKIQMKNFIEQEVTEGKVENIEVNAYGIQASDVLENDTDLTDNISSQNLTKIYETYFTQNPTTQPTTEPITDAAPHKVVFHENKPNGTSSEIQQIFREYKISSLTNNKVTHFYDIPSWAEDDYVFAGWYHNDNYTVSDSPDSNTNTPANFENDTYVERSTNYHLYAKWIPVGTVTKDSADKKNYGTNTLRGFDLLGIQYREPGMQDPNYDYSIQPPGLRFIAVISESLINQIDNLSTLNVDNMPLEYGFVAGKEEYANIFVDHYNVPANEYSLQYMGTNVNGVDTTGTQQTAQTDYRYISNLVCNSQHGTNGSVRDDHRNYNDYRIYSFVVHYDDPDESVNEADKASNMALRAYIRYYDANGKLRVFYNDYEDSLNPTAALYKGISACFNQIPDIGIPEDY